MTIRFFSILFIGLLFSACGSNSKNETHVQQSVKAEVVFDIPSLIGKNIDEIRKSIGKPVDKEIEPSALQMKTKGFNYWDNSFKKDGYTLQITYDPHTRKVNDFFISNNNAVDNTDTLRAIVNVNSNDTLYKLEDVKLIKDPSQFTGTLITPTQN